MARRRPELDERALIAACGGGAAAAGAGVDAPVRPVVERAAARALGRLGAPDPDALAVDVAGDVFAELLADERAALARFEGRSSLATWLRVVARRRAAKAVRRQRPGSDAQLDARAAPDPSPLDEAQARERRRLVREELDALADRDRLALQLFYQGGRSYKEVGRALDLPPARVGTVLARARARLGRALERLGG